MEKSMAQLVLYDEGWAATSFMQDVSIQEHINLSHNTSKLLVQTALLFASNQNDLHAIVFSIAYECLVQQQSLHQLPVSIMTCLRQCSLQLSPIHIIGGSSQRTRQNKNAKSKNNEIVHKSSTKHFERPHHFNQHIIIFGLNDLDLFWIEAIQPLARQP
jgi:hypothetical protein